MLDTTVLGELADLIGPSESDRENWRRITGEPLTVLSPDLNGGDQGPVT